MHTISPKRGFIALISVLILSAVLLVTVISLAQFGVASRHFLLDLENKTASAHLASSCVHIARVYAYNDKDRVIDSSNVEIVVTSEDPNTPEKERETCTIDFLEKIGITDNSSIHACAQVGESITNYEVVVNHLSGDVVSWEEIDALTTCP